MKKSAILSSCNQYRYELVRQWDERPMLLVMMFNPSDADAEVNDQTITLLEHVAGHNGYGGITVVNLVPYRSSKPAEAIAMVRESAAVPQSLEHPLRVNLEHIQMHAAKAGALLVAWGNLAPEDLAGYVEDLTGKVVDVMPKGVRVFCLGITKRGNPLHPMARGKQMVPKDALFKHWEMMWLKRWALM